MNKDFEMTDALRSVLEERKRQDEKWGEQNHDPYVYMAILMEELGELAQAVLQTQYGGAHGGVLSIRLEAVHTAAVALALLECLDRDKWISWRLQANLDTSSEIVIVYNGEDACTKCLGWKRVDDGEGASWKYWSELKPTEALAVHLGVVKPVVCPRCGGTGREPDKTDQGRKMP